MTMNTNTGIINTSTGITAKAKLSPAPFCRGELFEIALLILGVQSDTWEYWAEELDNGRVHIEVNPHDGEEWDAALSVFVFGEFIGDILLRGDIDIETDGEELGNANLGDWERDPETGLARRKVVV